MNNRISKEDVVRFVEVVRMFNRRLSLRNIAVGVALDWPAIHRLVARLEERGYVRKDRFNNRWLEKRLDEELAGVVEELADPQGEEWMDLVDQGWTVSE